MNRIKLEKVYPKIGNGRNTVTLIELQKGISYKKLARDKTKREPTFSPINNEEMNTKSRERRDTQISYGRRAIYKSHTE